MQDNSNLHTIFFPQNPKLNEKLKEERIKVKSKYLFITYPTIQMTTPTIEIRIDSTANGSPINHPKGLHSQSHSQHIPAVLEVDSDSDSDSDSPLVPSPAAA